MILKVSSVRGFKHNALYLGTSDGRILKFYDPGDGKTALVETVRIFARNVPIVNLLATTNQVCCFKIFSHFNLRDLINKKIILFAN